MSAFKHGKLGKGGDGFSQICILQLLLFSFNLNLNVSWFQLLYTNYQLKKQKTGGRLTKAFAPFSSWCKDRLCSGSYKCSTLRILTPQSSGFFEDLKTPLLCSVQVHSPFHWRVQGFLGRLIFGASTLEIPREQEKKIIKLELIKKKSVPRYAKSFQTRLPSEDQNVQTIKYLLGDSFLGWLSDHSVNFKG